MKAQLTPKKIQSGDTFYSVVSSCDNGKVSVIVFTYEVRSIRCKRGTQSRSGLAYLADKSAFSDEKYVNACLVDTYTKDKNTGKWLTSVPEWCKKQWRLSDERLPYGLYTTIEAAIRFEIHSKKESIKELKAMKKDPRYLSSIEALEAEEKENAKELVSLKTRLTKIKNKKAKA